MNVKTRVIEYLITDSGKMPAKEWLDNLKDRITQAIIYKRIRQAGEGNLGKTQHVGNGVHELKIDYGSGFRVYFGIHKDEMILLLFGGSKQTQQADIGKAKIYWKNWTENKNEK